MSQAPFAYMQMRPSAAVQNPPWLRAASSAGLGWDGMGVGGDGCFYSSTRPQKTERDRLATASLPSDKDIPSHRAGAVQSVNKDSKKWNLPLSSAFRQLFSWARQTGGYTRVQDSISRRTATLSSLTQKMAFNALTPRLAGGRVGRTD